MTTRPAKSARLTIFEGPDGGGKTTMAKEYATLTGARYIHHGPYKRVTDGLAGIILDSMLPALEGYEDIVLDRCWLSEPIYADAFRQGDDRVTPARARILERLALRCGAVIVRCLPPWQVVADCFNGRRDEEYLDNDQQLQQVYLDYAAPLNTALPVVDYDYTRDFRDSPALTATWLGRQVEALRARRHPLRFGAAGRWGAGVVVVGEALADHKNGDRLFQAPFTSLSRSGCSLWLADELARAGVSEGDLLWVNANVLWANPDLVEDYPDSTFIALGNVAHKTLIKLKTKRVRWTNHPQHHKRFRQGQPYDLGGLIKQALEANS